MDTSTTKPPSDPELKFNMREAICREEIPNDILLHEYLEEHFELARKFERVRDEKIENEIVRLDIRDLNLNYSGMALEIESAIAKHGFQSWAKPYSGGGRDPSYGGLPLTQNSKQAGRDWKSALFGLEAAAKLPYSAEDRETVTTGDGNLLSALPPQDRARFRGSYFDSLSFSFPTEIARCGLIGEFLARFRRPYFRSRIATQRLGVVEGSEGWHRDEPLHTLVRLIIPVTTVPQATIKLASGQEFSPEAGFMYTFNTRERHTVACTERIQFDRHCIVLCFAPWLDFDAGNDEFRENSYSGKTHPLEMARERSFFF